MMLFKYLFWITVGLPCLCFGIQPGQLTDEKREMDRWTDPEKSHLWKDTPTWHKSVGWDEDLMGGKPSYKMALALANSFYNWVSEQHQARSGSSSIVVSLQTCQMVCMLLIIVIYRLQ